MTDLSAVAQEAAAQTHELPSSQPTKPRNRRGEMLDRLGAGLVEELQDLGSERRPRRLLDLCERHGLSDLPKEALLATRRRLAAEGEQGPLGRPGAYYQRVLVALLSEHQVFVPTAAERGEADAGEVRRLARESLGAAGQSDLGAGEAR